VSYELESQHRRSSGGCVRAHPPGIALEASEEWVTPLRAFQYVMLRDALVLEPP
jgi:hypothetical protein